MDDSLAHEITFDEAAFYRIRVKGRIPGKWIDRMEGMAISQEKACNQSPVTILEGVLADQAALTGVLNTLYELHLPVLYVEYMRTS